MKEEFTKEQAKQILTLLREIKDIVKDIRDMEDKVYEKIDEVSRIANPILQRWWNL